MSTKTIPGARSITANTTVGDLSAFRGTGQPVVPGGRVPYFAVKANAATTITFEGAIYAEIPAGETVSYDANRIRGDKAWNDGITIETTDAFVQWLTI